MQTNQTATEARGATSVTKTPSQLFEELDREMGKRIQWQWSRDSTNITHLFADQSLSVLALLSGVRVAYLSENFINGRTRYITVDIEWFYVGEEKQVSMSIKPQEDKAPIRILEEYYSTAIRHFLEKLLATIRGDMHPKDFIKYLLYFVKRYA